MANFLADIGRTGGALTRTATNLTNTALAIRKSRQEDQLLPLKQANLAYDLEDKRLNTNIKRVELEKLRAEETSGNRPIEVTTLKKLMNNPEQAEKDYEYLKSSGYISKNSIGTEVILAKDVKKFRDEVQSTPIYKQSYNTANLKRYSNEVNQLKNQIDTIEQEYYSKGKTVEDAQKDKRMQPLLSQLGVSNQGKVKAMLGDKAIADLFSKLSVKYGMKATEQYFETGDASKLVPSSTSGKVSDFERAYQQHIKQPGNENVLRETFKTGAYAIPKGELSDDAVLRHFTDIAITDMRGAPDAQAMFQRFSENMKDGMPRLDAFNESKEWGLRRSTEPDIADDDFSNLWEDQVSDDLFTIHGNE